MAIVVNELRRDYFIPNRFVVIAVERAKRPKDFISTRPKEVKRKPCPFCPGNEHMTPPATLIYKRVNGHLLKLRDEGSERVRGWDVRIVHNKYPALRPTVESISSPEGLKATGYGYHEVVIETPRHEEQPSDARVEQLKLALMAMFERASAMYLDERIGYVCMFRNYGPRAGASLSHPHSQILAVPYTPEIIEGELRAFKLYLEQKGTCPLCDVVEFEAGGPREVYQNELFLVIEPWASRSPFETWVIPKRHMPTPLRMGEGEVRLLADTLNKALRALKLAAGDPEYNYWFHTAPGVNLRETDFHWHIEIVPVTSTWAGFERGYGSYINVLPPELAAEALRRALER